MRPHGSGEKGRNYDDGIVPYDQLENSLSEDLPGYAHLYSYGITKYKFLSDLLCRPVLNLEEFGCKITINLGRVRVASYFAIVLVVVAQRETQILSTSGCSITSKQNLM